MTKSLCILVILSFMAVVVCLASTAGAQGCVACGAEEDWGASAASFLEGKSVEDAPVPLWGPAKARLTNSQFSSNSTEEEANNTIEESSNAAQLPAEQAQNIVLRNASAAPNPANPGIPVSITAVLGGTTTAYAIIKNFADVQVGNVTLEQASGEEYIGVWSASIAAGDYKATIVASGTNQTRTFEDAVQIEVIDSSGASGSSRFKKLG